MPLETETQNLPNEFLLGLRNKTVIADVYAQIKAKSKILPHIKVINVEGDTFKIVGLKSNEPKDYTWGYKEQEFGPDEVVTYRDQFTNKDKKIFHTVFSEPIETLALGAEKAGIATAEQSAQVSGKIATFYDKDFSLNYASDKKRYNKEAIIYLNAEQLRDIQLVGEILITTGFQMSVASRRFNLQKDECNAEDTKKLLCFLDFSLYSRMIVASTYTTPSPVLSVLREHFTVIPIALANNCQASLIDSDALYLANGLNQRYLKLDEYVAAHKLLDHLWRKWIFVDFRPAFSIFYDEKAKTNPLNIGFPPPKDILKDFAELNDGDDNMSEDEAKAWEGFSFTFEQAKDWINIGLKCSDAEFVNWLVNTKGGDYADPKWVLDNSGQNGVKTIDELRAESKA